MSFKMLLALAIVLPSPAASQSLASRVAAAPDGRVQMRFAARSGVCGDGRDVVAFGRALYVYPSMESYGRWSGVTCVPGPLRVVLTLDGGSVTGVRTYVGGEQRAAASVTDLGVVSAPAAADFLVSLAATLPGSASRDAMLGAVLADSTVTSPALLRLARDGTRPNETRTRAIRWLGQSDEPRIIAAVDSIARDGAGESRIREAAVSSLAESPEGAGVPALIRAAQSSDTWLTKKAIFWLGQADDSRAETTLQQIIEDPKSSDDIKDGAIFALGQGGKRSDSGKFLKRMYKSLGSPRLRERVLQSVSESDEPDDQHWLLAVAADTDESVPMREKALFWAAQNDRVPTAELARVYRMLREPRLREHFTFVISQRNDTESLDELIRIARSDADPAVRKKAIFWLGQKDDPRAAAFLRELIDR